MKAFFAKNGPHVRDFISISKFSLKDTIENDLRTERGRNPRITSKIKELENEKDLWHGYDKRGRKGNDLKIALAARRKAASGRTVLLVTSDAEMVANENLTEHVLKGSRNAHFLHLHAIDAQFNAWVCGCVAGGAQRLHIQGALHLLQKRK